MNNDRNFESRPDGPQREGQDDVNVLALVKGPERYIFIYSDEQRVETLRQLGRYAADPNLSFSWYDAAILSKKVREIAEGKG